MYGYFFVFVSIRRRHTIFSLVSCFQTCALPILNGRWYSFMQEHLVKPVCAEFRHDLGPPTIEEMPLTQNESELVLGVNSRIFYLGVRKFIYGVDTPENVDAWVEMEIILFLDGVVNIYPGLVAPPQRRVRKPRL